MEAGEWFWDTYIKSADAEYLNTGVTVADTSENR